MTVNHPQFGTMCAICFNQLTPELCAEDTDGQKWDLCKGECARQAGMVEAAPDGELAAIEQRDAECYKFGCRLHRNDS